MKKIKYRSGYKYQLAKTYSVTVAIYPERPLKSEFISLSEYGLLIIKAGYAWDGPSGPCPDFKRVMRGSLIHDALYQLIREGLLAPIWRDEADEELKRACLEDGFPKVFTRIVYKSVDDFAAYAADPKNKKKVLEAP